MPLARGIHAMNLIHGPHLASARRHRTGAAGSWRHKNMPWPRTLRHTISIACTSSAHVQPPHMQRLLQGARTAIRRCRQSCLCAPPVCCPAASLNPGQNPGYCWRDGAARARAQRRHRSVRAPCCTAIACDPARPCARPRPGPPGASAARTARMRRLHSRARFTLTSWFLGALE